VFASRGAIGATAIEPTDLVFKPRKRAVIDRGNQIFLLRPPGFDGTNSREVSLTIGCSSEQQTAESKNAMLHYAIVFLIIAIVAGIFGLTGIAGTSAWIAHVLFVIFLILFIVSLLFRGRPPV
jgi:uncharacterized membrane protein YtjA (UPF0391 family)